MAFSRQELKIISIIQLVMSVILFALGIVDHFEVRYKYLSRLLMPCWIAALVLPACIMGFILAIRSRRSPILINWLTSISIASVVVSAVVLEEYYWALNSLLSFKYYKYNNTMYMNFRFFWDKDTKIKFEDQENTTIAIHALIVIFTICEIILAVAIARSSETGRPSPQENQPNYPYHHIESGQVPIQLQAFPTQAMMTIPIS